MVVNKTMATEICIVGCGAAKENDAEIQRATDRLEELKIRYLSAHTHEEQERIENLASTVSSLLFELKNETFAAKDIYRSNYFGLKREHAETHDEFKILSAKYGILGSETEISHYDTTVTDLEGDELDEWVQSVYDGLLMLSEAYPDASITVLAGRKYLEPLRDADVFENVPCEFSFPFEENDLGGIGYQMGWLKEDARRRRAANIGENIRHEVGQHGVVF